MLKEKVVKICGIIIEFGLLAIVFFIPIIMDYSLSSYNFFDLYKVVAFRIILTLVLLAYVAKIFVSGQMSYRGGHKIFLLASLALLSFFISSLTSVHPNDSFWGSFLRQQGFYNFLNYWLFFTLIILNFKDFKQAKRMVMAAAAAASIAAAYGLAQYFNLDPFYWVESALKTGRIFSTLGQPNFFGHYLILAIPLSLYGLIFIAKSLLARFLTGLSVLAQIICLAFTYSRAAWLGFLGAAVFLLLFWLLYKRFKKTAYAFIGLLLVGLVLAAAINLTGRPADKRPAGLDIIYRFKSIADLRGGSGRMRLYYIKSGLEEIKKESPLRLWFGRGPETLAGLYFKYYQVDWGVYEAINTMPDRAHNWLLDQILALGLFGLLTTLAFYGFIVYKTAEFFLRRPKLSGEDWLLVFLSASLVAYFINNFFSFSLFTVSVYLYFISALAWFIISREAAEKTIKLRLTAFSKILIWLSLLAVAALFIYTNNINQARAEIYYVKALESYRTVNCPGAAANMGKALDLSPNSSFYQENYLYLTLNCLPLAKNKIDQRRWQADILSRLEEFKDQDYYSLKSNLARLYTIFGKSFNENYYAEAEKIFNDLISDYPSVDSAYEDLGKQKALRGDYEAAISLYRRAIEVLPPLNHSDLNAKHREQVAAEAVRLYEALGQIYIKTKNYDLAFDYFKKGLSLDPYRATLYKNLADVYYLDGRLDEAVTWNKRGWMLNPRDYHWPLSLSLLYRDKKDLVKAKAYLNEALKLAPENQELIKYGEELNNK